MKRSQKLIYLLVILGLSILALRPYHHDIVQGWQDFQKAWQLVRAGETEPADEPEAIEETTDTRRQRTVITPDEIVDTTPQPSTPEDPFIAEARQRAAADPEAAMAWLQVQSMSQNRLRGMLEIVAVWAAKDSEGALLWLESNAQGLARHATIESGVALWAEQDPTTAAAWIEGMANDGSKATAAGALVRSWAASAPEAARQWVEQLPPGTIRSAAASEYVQATLASAPEAIADWAFKESTYQGNRSLFIESIRSYAQADPEAAASYLRDMQGSIDTPVAIEAYFQTRAQQAPLATMTWLAAQSNDDPLNQLQHTQLVMEEWSQNDSVAASEWLSQQTEGPKRDAAIAGFAETMIDYEPEAVAEWVNTLSNPDSRVIALENSIRHWARTQPHQALDWVKTAELEADLRTALASEIGAD